LRRQFFAKPSANGFETDYDVPFMLQVYQIREEKRAQIPGGDSRPTDRAACIVDEQQNARYYHLIEAFRDATGIPSSSTPRSTKTSRW